MVLGEVSLCLIAVSSLWGRVVEQVRIPGGAMYEIQGVKNSQNSGPNLEKSLD